MYVRARYYDPETGRWISRDPAALGMYGYAYATNQPVVGVDPSGAWPVHPPGYDFGDKLCRDYWRAGNRHCSGKQFNDCVKKCGHGNVDFCCTSSPDSGPGKCKCRRPTPPPPCPGGPPRPPHLPAWALSPPNIFPRPPYIGPPPRGPIITAPCSYWCPSGTPILDTNHEFGAPPDYIGCQYSGCQLISGPPSCPQS